MNEVMTAILKFFSGIRFRDANSRKQPKVHRKAIKKLKSLPHDVVQNHIDIPTLFGLVQHHFAVIPIQTEAHPSPILHLYFHLLHMAQLEFPPIISTDNDIPENSNGWKQSLNMDFHRT